MRKKLIIALVVVVVLLGGFAVVVAMQPAEYRVSRSAKMSATPAEVFAQVNDFKKWESWSAWHKVDPNAKYTYEGPTSGKDAAVKWAGNSEVGVGKMTILESTPNEHIKIKLDFFEPMAGTANTDFTFKPDGNQTLVTWSMDGNNNFIGKAFCLFMSMDKMIGSKYEEGLANIKAIVEPKK